MATEVSNSSKAQSPKPWTRPKRSGAGIAATVLIILAAAAIAIAFATPTDSRFGKYRGIVEISLNWFTILCFVLLPVWAICLAVSAIRGVSKGGYAALGVSRAESPLAFWMTCFSYLTLTVLSLLGFVKVIFTIVSNI